MLKHGSRIALSLVTTATAAVLAFGGAPAYANCSAGAADKPDLGFVDSNCDGVDGDKAAALFVAPNGNDNNDGSFGSPKASVLAAVNAGMTAHKDVYVAAGIYVGKVPFVYPNGNIGVYGGYDAQTWQRSAANVTTLEAPGQVVGVTSPGIVLQLLTVHSTDGSSTRSSYGVRAFGGGSVALSRVTILTAQGMDGAAGAPSPASPVTADAGGVGDPSGCNNWGAPGGLGGNGYLAGGWGGTWFDNTFQMKGHDGETDPNDPTISGGWGGQYAGQSGGAGTNGHQGTPGKGGTTALNRIPSYYLAESGNPGTGGTRGAGGGGGAASADDGCLPGSGGGAGGLPGAGGAGGQGGGGSIGLFAGTGAHVLVLDGSAIHTGNGGKGGYGAAGQGGGPGGLGGKAGTDGIHHSGAGGNGGWGGQGGQGGGGAGGASVGVLAVDSRAVVAQDTTFTLGAGGKGGTAGYNGADGVSSQTAQVTTAGGSVPAMGDFDGDGIDDAADACPLAAGPVNGCPAPEEVPTGPVAGNPTATGATTTSPTPVTVGVLPSSSCVSKRAFTIRINARKAHLRTARLVLDGRRLTLVKRSPRRWIAKVDLRHSTRTKHTLTIRGKLRNGRSYKQTRVYRTCGA